MKLNFKIYDIPKQRRQTNSSPLASYGQFSVFVWGYHCFWSDKMKEQLRVFFNWVVSPDGTIEHISPDYIIEPDLLRSGTDWIDHMSQKNWVDIQSFSSAYEYALSITRGNNG